MLIRRKLRKYIKYDKVTGVIETQCKITLQGVGNVRIEIEDVTYRLTDVVYAFAYGSIPKYAKVVQINKNSKLDFRLCNLKLDLSKVEKLEKENQVKQRRLLREAKKLKEEEMKAFNDSHRYSTLKQQDPKTFL